MVRLLPRIFSFIIDKARFARKVESFLPQMQSTYQELYLADARQLNDRELIGRIQRLIELTSETAYYNIIISLLMQVYNAILRRNITSAGSDFTNLDLLAGMDQIREYDPGVYLLQLHQLYMQLPPAFQPSLQVEKLMPHNRQQNWRSFAPISNHLSSALAT